MKKYLSIALLAVSMNVNADAEQDKKAGTCAMYLALAAKSKVGNYKYGPADALAMADKESRALQHSQMFADKIRDYQARKQSTSPLIHQGVSDCYAIGLKLSN